MGEIAKKSVQTFLTRVALQAVSIGGSIVVARMLGASGKGVFTYAYMTLALLLMLNGQPYAIAWQFTKRSRSPAALLHSMGKVLACVALPAALALAAVGLVLPDQRALIAVAAALPFAMFAQSATGFFLADSDVRSINVQTVVSGIIPILCYTALLLFFHVGLTGLLIAWAAGYVWSAAYTILRLRPYAGQRDGDDSGPLIPEQLKYAAQMGLGNAVMFLNSRIDVFIIMFLLGRSALGVYSIGIGIGEMLWQLSRPIATAMFGRIARGTEAESAQATAACMRHSFALVLVTSIPVAALVPLVIPLVYGRAFSGAVIVTELLLPGMVAYSMMGALTTFFSQQLGEPRLPLYFRLASAIICGVVTVLTIPHIGIAGGAIATTVSYLVTFAAAVVHFCRHTKISPKRLFLLSRDDVRPYFALLYGLRARFQVRQA